MFRLGLAQIASPNDGDVLAQARTYAHDAANQGVDLLVFPEAFMTPSQTTCEEFKVCAEPLGGLFTQAMARIAEEVNLWVIYTMCETASNNEPPYNTAVIMDNTGNVQSCYRKVHLFDSDVATESEHTTPGEELFTPIGTPFCNIGIGICYDLRFPELSRKQALEGADLLVFPSAWYAGPHKYEQWKALLQARAIENECFVAGLSKCGGKYLGCSLVASPDGTILAEATDAETLVVADIDLSALSHIRSAIPVFSHRRPSLY